MGAELVGGLVAGIGALTAAGVSAASSSSNTNLMLGENREENERNRQWSADQAYQSFLRNRLMQEESSELQMKNARELFDMTNSYNTPSAMVQRLQEAGINPSVALSQLVGGAGNAQMPSAPSPVGGSNHPIGISPSMFTTQPSTVNLSGAFEGIANALESLSSSSQKDVETKRTTAMLGGELKLLAAKANNQELLNTFQEVENSYQKMDLPRRVERSIQDTLRAASDALFSKHSANYMDEKYLTQQFETLNSQLESQLKGEQLTQAKITSNYFEESLLTNLSVMRSERSRNLASASESLESARSQRFTNDILENNPDARLALKQNIVYQAKILQDKHAISESQAREAAAIAEKLEYANEHKEFEYWSGKLYELVDHVGGAAGDFLKFKYAGKYFDMRNKESDLARDKFNFETDHYGDTYEQVETPFVTPQGRKGKHIVSRKRRPK